MNIVVSGKFSLDVADDARELVKRFNDILSGPIVVGIKANINGMVFFPVIISDDFQIQTKSARSFSKKESSEFVNVEVSHSEWIRADDAAKTCLMLCALQQAVLETSDAKISPESKLAILKAAAQGLGFN